MTNDTESIETEKIVKVTLDVHKRLSIKKAKLGLPTISSTIKELLDNDND